MKKRILALLLAGLMTASMAACVSSGEGGEGTGTGDASGSLQATVAIDPSLELVDVDETVYTITETAKLLSDVKDTKAKHTLDPLTELKRVKSGNKWSVVEYKNAQYFVLTNALSSDDLMGKEFEEYSTPITMYATSNVKIRVCASIESFSTSIATLKTGDTVKVVAEGDVGNMTWSKIEYTDEEGETLFYFVSSKYLSTKQGGSADNGDGSDDVNYAQYFEDCTPKTMYVVVENAVNVRETPSFPEDNRNVIGSLANGAEVIVIAKGTGSKSGWSQIKIPNVRQDPADPQTYYYGYISSKFLSPVPGGEFATLEGLLGAYTTLTKLDPTRTMYVAASAPYLNVRATPDFDPNTTNNIVGGIEAKAAVTVLAEGSVDGVSCYVIQYSIDGKSGIGFVSAKYITPDANGTPAQTLTDLLKEYTAFQQCEAKTYYVISATGANCRLTPATTSEVTKKLNLGDAATVVATGSYNGAEMYVLQIDGSCYFAAAELFGETAPAVAG